MSASNIYDSRALPPRIVKFDFWVLVDQFRLQTNENFD